MVNGEPARRAWAPRILAPLAFFAAATALVLLVHGALNAETESATAPTATLGGSGQANERSGETREKKQQAPRRKRFYRIRAGDTLEAIALRFDTTVDELLTLNPGVDANSLTPGQRIRIR